MSGLDILKLSAKNNLWGATWNQHNLLMAQISEWSLMPICETPECENLWGLLVMNKSIVVAVPAVVCVGL